MATAQLRQLNVIVSDMSAALSFYRELGWTIESATPVHATVNMPDGIHRRVRQPPYDAFWGSRYAIVEDPDGNPVGLMSRRQESQKYWPPIPLRDFVELPH
jgi:predicted enzyme related to lactoylglutathione lyase